MAIALKKGAKKAAKKTVKKSVKKSTTKATTKASGSGSAKGSSSPKAKPSKAGSEAQRWVERIQKEKKLEGKAQVIMASEVITPYHLRRPTGIPSLDIAMGGGLHAGGGMEIHGTESVGKTHLAYCIAGQVQKNYGDKAAILIFCTEIRPDVSYARLSGFQMAYSDKAIEELDSIRQSQGLPGFTPEEVEDLKSQIGEVVVVTASTADYGLDVIIKALEAGFFQLVIIESLGAFLTQQQEGKDTGERTVAGPAMMVTTFQNKVYPLFMMDRSDGSLLETTIIGVNQARANVGGGPKAPKTQAAMGAFSWKHGQLLSVELRKGVALKNSKKQDIGREVGWKLKKGKAGTHDGLSGTYHYFHMKRMEPVFWKDVQTTFFGGVDEVRDLVDAVLEVGAVERAGAWIRFGENGKWNGQEPFLEAVVASEQLQAELREALVKTSGLLVRYS